MRGSSQERWWSRRWQSMLDTLGLAGQPTAQGQPLRIRRLDVAPGQIDADVIERDSDSALVTVRFDVWTREEWQQAIDALSSQALFAAQLLAGELPPQLDAVLEQAGVTLLPASADALHLHCSLDGEIGGSPCMHVAETLRAVGGLLDEDPWLLFRLRGREQRQLLRYLRQQRTRPQATTNGHSTTVPQYQPDRAHSSFLRSPWDRANEPRQELLHGEGELDPADYWGNRKQLDEFRPAVAPPKVDLVLLRRLGFPPFACGSGATYDALAEIYRTVTARAMELAYASEAPEQTSASDGAE